MVEFLPCGDTAFSVQFGEVIDRTLCLKVLQLKEAMAKARLPGVLETVPTYRSLLVHYDPLITCQSKLCTMIAALAEREEEIQLRPKRWLLPVCFEEEFAWDLAEISDSLKLSEAEILDILTTTELFIYMIGFTMGLLYLGDFPEFERISRRTTPRTKLVSGAVAVARGMAVVYPIVSPGGWNVIGNSPAPLFDIYNTPPSSFSPGDAIRFQAIDKKDWKEIRDMVAAGVYHLESEQAAEVAA